MDLLNEGSGTRYNDGVSRFNSNRIVPSMAFLSGGRVGEGRVSAILLAYSWVDSNP